SSRALLLSLFDCSCPHPVLHSFPTRRSSDLYAALRQVREWGTGDGGSEARFPARLTLFCSSVEAEDARAMGDSGLVVETEATARSEEHTSELQSRENLVCRLLLEKKKT